MLFHQKLILATITYFLSLLFFHLYIENNRAQIAFITAIYGTYEKTLKQPVNQTILCDFIAFTDRYDLIASNKGWKVVTDPYHRTIKIFQNTGYNSVENNSHPFNIAKFYKMQFHRIPLLANYKVIVWLDGTISIKNTTTAASILNLAQSGSNFLIFEHWRNGLLSAEVAASDNGRYYVLSWAGHGQPYQNVSFQYDTYVQKGYKDHWWPTNPVRSTQFGVWVTCFVGFDMRQSITRKFLDVWWSQNLHFTTQDQVSFPYVLWKLKIMPYSLPNQLVLGNSHVNSWFKKLDHGL